MKRTPLVLGILSIPTAAMMVFSGAANAAAPAVPISNSPITAKADFITLYQGDSADLDVLANDTNSADAPLMLTSVTNSCNYACSGGVYMAYNSPNMVNIYANGDDISASYTVADGLGNSAAAMIYVHVLTYDTPIVTQLTPGVYRVSNPNPRSFDPRSLHFTVRYYSARASQSKTYDIKPGSTRTVKVPASMAKKHLEWWVSTPSNTYTLAESDGIASGK